MASLSNPVNVNKLLATQLAAQKAEINAHVDSKTTETKAHVTNKSTDTKNHVTSKNTDSENVLSALVSAENDATQILLADVATGVDVGQAVSDVISGVNTNTDEKLGALSLSPIKSIQRGESSHGTVNIAPVDMSKTVVNLLTSLSAYRTGSGATSAIYKIASAKLVSPNELSVYCLTNNVAWEVIEYV